MSTPPKLVSWYPNVEKPVTDRMFPNKLQADFRRPTALDTLAKQAIVISERSTCMWYEVGAVIFLHHEKSYNALCDGYNGAASGDVDPHDVGCARVVDGKVQEGAGLCRGSHAELNAISKLHLPYERGASLEMIVTLHPCFSCAKQIVNAKIKKVYYLWEYGREEKTSDYLKGLGVEVDRYESPHLLDWIKRNQYNPIGAEHPRSW
jgi:dCMP deaminase